MKYLFTNSSTEVRLFSKLGCSLRKDETSCLFLISLTAVWHPSKLC